VRAHLGVVLGHTIAVLVAPAKVALRQGKTLGGSKAVPPDCLVHVFGCSRPMLEAETEIELPKGKSLAGSTLKEDHGFALVLGQSNAVANTLAVVVLGSCVPLVGGETVESNSLAFVFADAVSGLKARGEVVLCRRETLHRSQPVTAGVE